MIIPEKRLEEIFKNFNGKRVAIIGDLMIDRYFWGHVTRISPEAPVPVVEIESESNRLGGAANVANNIKSLGGIPMLLGLLGNDGSGKNFLDICKQQNLDTSGIVSDDDRPTTVKTRVIAHNQHVVRVDRESKTEANISLQQKLLQILESNISTIDAVIIEDYNKGVVGKEIISGAVKISKKYDKIITIDPKFNNFFEYKNVTVFKPNRKETEEALGIKLTDDKTLEYAGKKLIETLQAEHVIITRGEYGMAVFGRNGSFKNIQTTARSVLDVSGAGDTVISTLTMAMASGANIIEAATMSNTAGGIVCSEVGIVPIEKDELYQTLLEEMNHRPPRKAGA